MSVTDPVTDLAVRVYTAVCAAEDSLLMYESKRPTPYSHKAFTYARVMLLAHIDGYTLNAGEHGSALALVHKRHLNFTAAFEDSNSELKNSLKVIGYDGSDVKLQLIFNEPELAFQRYSKALASVTQRHLALEGHRTALMKLAETVKLEDDKPFRGDFARLGELRDRYFLAATPGLITEYLQLANSAVERYLQSHAIHPWQEKSYLFFQEKLVLYSSELEVIAMMEVID
jgi:hypothetical protein